MGRKIAAAFLLVLLLGPSYGQLTSTSPLVTHTAKISPVLKDAVAYSLANPVYDHALPTIVIVKQEFWDQAASGQPDDQLLPLIRSYTAQLTAQQIVALLGSDPVEYITLDTLLLPSASEGENVSLATIGADRVRADGYDGSGIVAAIFDSGIGQHPDIDPDRKVVSVDATSGTVTVVAGNSDGYGHGTHVAGIFGGTGRRSGGLYAGVATGASFVDVKVIGSDGSGKTSNLIKAIDWVVQNRKKYKIRVGNFSLGRPPIDSAHKDPACRAVAKLIEAGVVCVVSSGNLGKTNQYPKIWGAIGSPGNTPGAITVYPINTRGTSGHQDDIATSYGSRGPTYKDGLFKSDLSAPGNRIVAPRAKGSWIDLNYSENRVGEDYITLSGSSMATPYVAGAVALMLQANPALSPNLVKAILSLTAVRLEQPHMLEQGNGMLNAETAVALAKAIDVKERKLTRSVPPQWRLNGSDVWAGGALASGKWIGYSRLVDTTKNHFWGQGRLWSAGLFGDASHWADGILGGDGTFWADSLAIWGNASHWADGTSWADGTFWADGVNWADTAIGSDGSHWCDSSHWADGTNWCDSSHWADGSHWADSALAGDPQ